MCCDQRSQYITLNSKKNSFRGNYLRKYGKYNYQKRSIEISFFDISRQTAKFLLRSDQIFFLIFLKFGNSLHFVYRSIINYVIYFYLTASVPNFMNSNRIVGGNTASSPIPWQVSIRQGTGANGHFCGGNIFFSIF